MVDEVVKQMDKHFSCARTSNDQSACVQRREQSHGASEQLLPSKCPLTPRECKCVCEFGHKTFTIIGEIFVRVKISYSSVPQLSYATNFRTAKVVSHALVYVQGFRMLLNFVLSAKSTKYTKLNRVRKFVRLQYHKCGHGKTSSPGVVGFEEDKKPTEYFL